MSYTSVENAIYAWILAVIGSGIPIIWDKQNVGRPGKTYVLLAMDSYRRTGDDYQGQPGSGGSIHITGNRDLTLNIQTFGANSRETLEKVRQSCYMPKYLDPLRAAGVCVFGDEPIMDLTALLGTEWEERASIDIMLRYGEYDAAGTDATVGLILHTEHTNTFNHSGISGTSNAIAIENISIP